jgi:hypothetical protein
MRLHDHAWYRIQYAFWIWWDVSGWVTPAFAWDCATSWDWGIWDGFGVSYTPREAANEEMSNWDGE